jgi:hypothetical protein
MPRDLRDAPAGRATASLVSPKVLCVFGSVAVRFQLRLLPEFRQCLVGFVFVSVSRGTADTGGRPGSQTHRPEIYFSDCP